MSVVPGKKSQTSKNFDEISHQSKYNKLQA